MTTRPLRPRPAVAVVPLVITDDDASCFPVVGLTARRLRELVHAFAIPHARLRRRILVRVADLDAALVRHAVNSDEQGAGGPGEPCDPESDTVDDVLARVGRRRVR